MGCSIHTAAHPVGIKRLKTVCIHLALQHSDLVIWISSLKFVLLLNGRGIVTKAETVFFLFMISFRFPAPLPFRQLVLKITWKRLPGHISVALYPVFRVNRARFSFFLSSTYIEPLNVVSALGGFCVA